MHLLLLGLTLYSLSGCAAIERSAQENRFYHEAQASRQQEVKEEADRLIATIPLEEQLDCKMRAQAVLATERVYNVGLPTLWDGQQTTYGQGALQVYYTCLDMKLAKMAAKIVPETTRH